MSEASDIASNSDLIIEQIEVGPMQNFFNSGFSVGAQDYYEAQAALDLEGFEQQKAMDGIYVPTPFREAIGRFTYDVPIAFLLLSWTTFRSTGRFLGPAISVLPRRPSRSQRARP